MRDFTKAEKARVREILDTFIEHANRALEVGRDLSLCEGDIPIYTDREIVTLQYAMSDWLERGEVGINE